jgi:nitroimidazol reductase NimA-like FMN-containing flavoprotein (pyridoxamine 5'-phosphate oxidase superfamily)
MGVRLTEEEINEFLNGSHTLIIATTRQSGEPFMTPVWYVWMDGAFWTRTGMDSPKVKHIKRSPRVCCLVEEGEKWVDLRAVISSCHAEIVADQALIDKVGDALDAKYASFKMEQTAMPDATKKHYASTRAIIKMTPREGEKIRSWYNRKIRPKAAA